MFLGLQGTILHLTPSTVCSFVLYMCILVLQSFKAFNQCILTLAIGRAGAVLMLQYYRWTERKTRIRCVFFSKLLSIHILKSVDNVQPLWKSRNYLYAKSYLLGQWHSLD